MDYEDHVIHLREVLPSVAAEVAALRGLEGVMAWMARRGLPLSSAEIIAQDEYSLDFVVPLDAEGAHVAFGVT